MKLTHGDMHTPTCTHTLALTKWCDAARAICSHERDPLLTGVQTGGCYSLPIIAIRRCLVTAHVRVRACVRE